MWDVWTYDAKSRRVTDQNGMTVATNVAELRGHLIAAAPAMARAIRHELNRREREAGEMGAALALADALVLPLENPDDDLEIPERNLHDPI